MSHRLEQGRGSSKLKYIQVHPKISSPRAPELLRPSGCCPARPTQEGTWDSAFSLNRRFLFFNNLISTTTFIIYEIISCHNIGLFKYINEESTEVNAGGEQECHGHNTNEEPGRPSRRTELCLGTLTNKAKAMVCATTATEAAFTLHPDALDHSGCSHWHSNTALASCARDLVHPARIRRLCSFLLTIRPQGWTLMEAVWPANGRGGPGSVGPPGVQTPCCPPSRPVTVARLVYRADLLRLHQGKQAPTPAARKVNTLPDQLTAFKIQNFTSVTKMPVTFNVAVPGSSLCQSSYDNKPHNRPRYSTQIRATASGCDRTGQDSPVPGRSPKGGVSAERAGLEGTPERAPSRGISP